jgi:hypothetical protein
VSPNIGAETGEGISLGETRVTCGCDRENSRGQGRKIGTGEGSRTRTGD